MDELTYSILISLLIGYFAGGINPAYILAKMKGFDIRTKGSGNPGASNAVTILGKKAGIFVAVFDVFKAFASYKICAYLFPAVKAAGIVAGIACVLGHMFPAVMKFKGGKGLASAGGLILAYNPKIFGLVLLVELVIAFGTNYISLVPTTGSVIFIIVLYVIERPVYALMYLPVVIAIWVKHMVNFKRIRYGVEGKIESFWNKAKDKKRMKENWDKLTDEQKAYVDMKEFNF